MGGWVCVACVHPALPRGKSARRLPRKEEEEPGARTDAATPPAPQTMEWDAVYSAINEGREEGGGGRGGTKAKKDDQSLIC